MDPTTTEPSEPLVPSDVDLLVDPPRVTYSFYGIGAALNLSHASVEHLVAHSALCSVERNTNPSEGSFTLADLRDLAQAGYAYGYMSRARFYDVCARIIAEGRKAVETSSTGRPRRPGSES